MKLLSITLHNEEGYKGLTPDTFDFSNSEGRILAFIGLNGSGKSLLLELIAETFAFLERKQRRDFKTRTSLGFSTTLIYQLSKQSIHSFGSAGMSFGSPLGATGGLSNPTFKVQIEDTGNVIASLYRDEQWQEINFQALELPRYVIGYSSGLNENLQRSFMKNAVQFYDVMHTRLRWKKAISEDVSELELAKINKQFLKRYPHIFSASNDFVEVEEGYLSLEESDTRLPKSLFLDYDSSAILMTSFALLDNHEIDVLLSEVRFKYPKRVKLRYDLRNGLANIDSVNDIRLLIRAGGEGCVEGISQRTTDQQYDLYELDYLAGFITLDLSRQDIKESLSSANYGEPLRLFERLYKLQLLGVSNWQGANKSKLRKCNFQETVKKPLKGKQPLSVERLELADEQGKCVNFDDFSDGEAQLIQIVAATRLFRDEQTLFLFDEPETHLNPSWRTYFHQHLTNASRIEYVGSECTQTLLSTHSPFMVSSLKKTDVYRFERDSNDSIKMNMASNQTYGASFDVLIKEYFDLKSLISQTVVEDIREQLKKGDAEALSWINENLGSSPEKAYLQRKLSQ